MIKKAVLPLLLGALLVACGAPSLPPAPPAPEVPVPAPQPPQPPLPPQPPEPPPSTVIHGVPILYRVVPLSTLRTTPERAKVIAQAILGSPTCTVEVGEGWLSAWVVAHEVAHCLDYYRLNYTHGGFQREGCALREYACAPEEGYADTYALLYLKRFGPRLDVLGWPGEPTTSEQPPTAEEVTPALVPSLRFGSLPGPLRELSY